MKEEEAVGIVLVLDREKPRVVFAPEGLLPIGLPIGLEEIGLPDVGSDHAVGGRALISAPINLEICGPKGGVVGKRRLHPGRAGIGCDKNATVLRFYFILAFYKILFVFRHVSMSKWRARRLFATHLRSKVRLGRRYFC